MSAPGPWADLYAVTRGSTPSEGVTEGFGPLALLVQGGVGSSGLVTLTSPAFQNLNRMGRVKERGPRADRAAHSTQGSPAPTPHTAHRSPKAALPAASSSGRRAGAAGTQRSSVTQQMPAAPLTSVRLPWTPRPGWFHHASNWGWVVLTEVSHF